MKQNIVLIILAFLLSSSCKKKCDFIGNGVKFKFSIHTDNAWMNKSDYLNIKYFYQLANGAYDTLKKSAFDENGDFNSDNKIILILEDGFSTEMDPIFANLMDFSTAILTGKTKDNNFYLKFPDGKIDTMSLFITNKVGCEVNRGYYYFDSLLYNGKPAEFFKKEEPNDIKASNNWFKIYK
ncbi:MAG TPA: hypothetical protein VLZ83_09335 [Edaphocola sp.]|nr:hypothetical protein [Edaphocola sp.]